MTGPRPTTPRIDPVLTESLSASAQEILQNFTSRGSIPNFFATLVNYEGLTRRWLPFGAKVLNGKIPIRDRELLILRTGWLCQSKYEWTQHVVISLNIGIAQDEIDRVKIGPSGGWRGFDLTLLNAADELHGDSCVSDATWAELANVYNTQQLIELPLLVGQYHLVAMATNTLGVQLDADLPDVWA